MNKILISILLIASANIYGQAPMSFNYQGVARDNTGNAIASKTVCLRLSILDNSSSGNTLYMETHAVTTNQFGLFSTAIGMGNPVQGNFGAVAWNSANSRWLKVELDDKCANNYTLMGSSQFLSVPYAMYAANPGPKGDKGDQGIQGVQGIAGAAGAAGSANINGTQNYIVKFTNSTTGGNSSIYDNNGQVSIGTTSPASTSKFEVETTGKDAIVGSTNSTYFGVLGQTSGTGAGVVGTSTSSGDGVSGASATGDGVHGESNSSSGVGVNGYNGSGGDGVYGESNGSSSSSGVYGYNSGSGDGVYGKSIGSSASGITGLNTSTGYGVYGSSSAGTGVYGYSNSSTYAGIFAANSTGYALWSSGDAHINGSLSKSSGSFLIDHPQFPETKYLYHSFVESPDMMNIYNGNITTDANGNATVSLPSYFQAENMGFRYQLTPLGQLAIAAVIDTIADNKFTIKTDKPNVTVSWQVTGIRNDKYAQQHRIVAEVDKKGDAVGKYLNPEVFGQPKEKAIMQQPNNDVVLKKTSLKK